MEDDELREHLKLLREQINLLVDAQKMMHEDMIQRFRLLKDYIKSKIELEPGQKDKTA